MAYSFELERTIVDCVRHNDMQVRVDHRTRTVHFGSNVSDVSVSEVEGPHLQVTSFSILILYVLCGTLKDVFPSFTVDHWTNNFVRSFCLAHKCILLKPTHLSLSRNNVQGRPIKMRAPILYFANCWMNSKMLLTPNRF